MSASLKPKVSLSVAATNKAKDEKATTPTSASGRGSATSSGAAKAAPGMTRGASVGGDVDPKSGAAEQVKDIWTQVIEHLNDEKRKAEEPAKAATAGGGDGKAADGKDAKGDAKGSDANAKVAAAGPSGREAVFLVVGSAGGGKTSLLMQYIPNKEELGTKGPPAPTTALEYRYARATVGLSTEKELSHFWELGGGRQMTRLLDIAITPDNIRDALCIVVVDLSKPSKVVDDVQYWLDTIRARAEQCWAQLRAVGSDVPDRMAANAKAQFDPTEFDKLNVLALPTLIVASKYDVFASKDPEMQKMMARTLRALAHNHGCGLVYCSVREDFQATVKWFISRLNRHASNKGPSTTIQLDHRQPLSVPPGTDKMANIGQPPKAASSFLSGWIASYNAMFPKHPAEWTDDTGARDADLKLSEEPLLEPILAAKNDDLKKLQQDSALRRKIKAADSEASKRAAAANN